MLKQLLLQIVLILCNAFFAATEIAVISLNEKKVRALASDGDKRAKKMLRIIETPTQFLSTIQIGITLAGFLGSAFAADNFAETVSAFLVRIFRIAPITGLIGTFIGIIPGAGADIGSFVGYNAARALSKEPEKLGTGCIDGVIGPEGGNNGVTGGAMIPMLTLGVPGDAVTAIMIGALTIQGLTPGPMLFQTNKVLVYTIFLGMFIANTLMCICGFAGIRLFTKVLSVPKVILTPCIFVLCVVGSFAMRNNIFDVWVMLISGIIGYFLTKVKVPTSPAILGLILGPMAEKNFRTALLKSSGDPSVFFSTAICWVFIGLILISLCGGHAKEFMASLRRKRAAAKEAKGA